MNPSTKWSWISALALLNPCMALAQLAITTTRMPTGTIGVPYSASLGATGGTSPYTWSVGTGMLPPGLTLNPSSGGISGTPTSANTNSSGTGTFSPFPLIFQVQDSQGHTATANLPIEISDPIVIQTTSLPAGTVGVAYSACLAATGGAAASSGGVWSLVGGMLPPGIGLTQGPGCRGLLTGTPTQAGQFPLQLQVTDVLGGDAQVSLALTINGGSSTSITLTVTPASLAFTAPGGGAAPSPQSVQVGVSSGSLGFSAAVTQGVSWLSVSPGAGTTPGAFSVTVTPGNLGPGQYPGTIQIMATGVSNSPQSVAVTLTVPTPTPAVAKVESAASYQGSALAPGSLVTIMGTSLGPAAGVSMAPSANGVLGTTLSGTQVLFNGVAAPLLYASSGQINAILPFAAAGQINSAGQSSLSGQVTYNGLTSSSFTVPIAPAAPALFTVSASGAGPGAILNQDLSPNSATNPAAAGSAVVLYGSGGGQFQPPLPDGEVTGANLSQVVLPVTAQVGGTNAKVLYAGSAPGLVAGAMQINVQIPAGTPAGNVPVTITINGVASQAGVTVAVR